ncbi:MAG: glycosyltransferase family 4 protein [Thermoplasmata archaeon]
MIEDQEMDLVHDDISPFPTLYPHWLCEKSNIPKLATIHNFQGSLVSWVRRYGIMGIGGSLGEGALRKGYLRYDHIITDSSWLQQDLAQDLPTHKVSWIPNGVDTNHFRPVKSTEIRSGVDGSVTFLCVGRFVGLKGHNVLLRSFVRLRKKGLKIRLVLVGTGPRLQAVKTLSEQLSIGSSVSFLDHVSHDRMPRIYQDADVFILPSISEGMSFALLEAMSSGLPTIASDIPGNRAVVDDATGILVPPRREEELSMAMERLAVDETQRQGMARSARRKIVKMFTWERIAQRQFDLFISCIENRRNDSS